MLFRCFYLHAEGFPVLPAAVDELLQSVSVFGLLVRLQQLLLDVLLYLGVDEVPRLQTLEEAKAGGEEESARCFHFLDTDSLALINSPQ